MKREDPISQNNDADAGAKVLPFPQASRPGADHDQARGKVCEHIEEDGLSENMAALLAGMGLEELRHCKQQDERFSQQLDRARAAYQQERRKLIREAGAKDWRAQAWLVEHPPKLTEEAVTPTDDVDGLPRQMFLTKAHLEEMQQRREAAITAMQQEQEQEQAQPQPESAQP